MSSSPLSLPARRPAPARVLGDVIPGGLVRDAALVVGGSALVGVAAQLSVPLPGTPVPLTLQTLAVLMVAASLGTVRGVASLVLYTLAGLAGVPWFSHGQHGYGGASFGYVLGFVLAAAVVGRLAEQGATRSPARTAGVMLAGELLIYAVGVPWLMVVAHLGPLAALSAGLVPFLVGDAVKLAVAAGLLPFAWRLLGRR